MNVSISLNLIKHTKQNRERFYALETLCLELLRPCIIIRDDRFAQKNYHGVQTSLVKTIKKTTDNIAKFLTTGKGSPKSSPIGSPKLVNRKYCKLCPSQSHNSRYKECCAECGNPICPGHSVLHCINRDKN